MFIRMVVLLVLWRIFVPSTSDLSMDAFIFAVSALAIEILYMVSCLLFTRTRRPSSQGE